MYALSLNGLGSKLTLSDTGYWLQLAIWLAISAGLFFYVRLAKYAFVAFYIVQTILSFFWGMWVLTPYASVLISLTGLVDGAIIFMVFFSSVANRFSGIPNKALYGIEMRK
jgi:uncharacterized membrane protein